MFLLTHAYLSRIRITGSKHNVIFNFYVNTAKLFSKMVVAHFHQHLVFLIFFILAKVGRWGRMVVLYCGFILHVSNEVEHLFYMLISHSKFFFYEVVVQVFCSFFYWVVCIFLIDI